MSKPKGRPEKKRREFNWKRFGATLVIVIVALIFTASIFVSYIDVGSGGQGTEIIAEVNGKPLEFYGNSPVIREYERLRDMYKTRTKEEVLRKAVQNVITSMLLEEFADRNGFDLSEEFIDKVTSENVYSIARKTNITSSDIKLARLNIESFLKGSYLPLKVDTFVNRIPKRSQTSFYLFKSLDDLKISLTIVKFDEVEFVRSAELFTNSQRVNAFYIDNYKWISLEAKLPIKVEKYVFDDRRSAYSFVSNGEGNPVEKVTIELDPDRNKNIIANLPDKIYSLSKPLFENRKYVVYKVISIPSFTSLSPKVIDYISLKYTISNYAFLIGNYSEAVADAIETMKKSLSKDKIAEIEAIRGAEVYSTGKFSIVKALSEFIPSPKGEALELPRGVYEVSVVTSWFRKKPGEVEVIEIDPQTKIIYKVASKEIIPSKVSEVADKISLSYQFLYQEAINAEWNKMIEKSGNVKIKDVSRFAKEL